MIGSCLFCLWVERRRSLDQETKSEEELGEEKKERLFKKWMLERGLRNSEEELSEFRHRMHISVMGGDIPQPITSFDEMPFGANQAALKRTILRNIEGFGNQIIPFQL